MADGTNNKNRVGIMMQISAAYDELVTLKIKPEREDLNALSFEALLEELEAVSEQLKTRKRFLGMKNEETKTKKRI